jgi:outer membrane lipoprotein-sorting protein
MKKLLSIFAIALLTTGLFSCEAETDVQDTEAMVKSISVDIDQSATEGKQSDDDDRGGSN